MLAVLTCSIIIHLHESSVYVANQLGSISGRAREREGRRERETLYSESLPGVAERLEDHSESAGPSTARRRPRVAVRPPVTASIRPSPAPDGVR